MKVLLVGSGGREHALAWRLVQNPLVELWSSPGSPALARLGEVAKVPVDDLDGLKKLASQIEPDLTVVGPELPLVLGLADQLREMDLPVFGPSKKAARVEGSKIFAKDFMVRHNLPTAGYAVFDDESEAENYLKASAYPVVLKADGLAAGKGVVVAGNYATASRALKTLLAGAGAKLIVEEYLAGEELSCFALCDGKNFLSLIPAQDHKTIYDCDRGPNTGGMGAYAPAPLGGALLTKLVEDNIFKPAVEGLSVEGTPFTGLLYAGLMVGMNGPKLLEFNARFGDPETQALMPLLESDLADLLLAAATGNLKGKEIRWSGKASVCVVVSAEGYPGEYRKGDEIKGIDRANAREDVVVFEAGVGVKGDVPITNGGRVLGVTATGDNLKEAVKKAYQACGDISFQGMHYRKDIGEKGALKEYSI
ncbi:MAG: phosphoribosylamine--glycine ligase [Deltaproteobacteria bacterium]|jgi:phosphoribosylamine--glycine ligase|nr:phosphoribosylamine--glycine ligase [Deltaproteobacteria bacterium]